MAPLYDINNLLLDCPVFESLRKSIFGSTVYTLYFRPLIQTLGRGPMVRSPRSSFAPLFIGWGRVAPRPPIITTNELLLPSFLIFQVELPPEDDVQPILQTLAQETGALESDTLSSAEVS